MEISFAAWCSRCGGRVGGRMEVPEDGSVTEEDLRKALLEHGACRLSQERVVEPRGVLDFHEWLCRSCTQALQEFLAQ